MFSWLVAFLSMVLVPGVVAAPLSFVPQRVFQPDGTMLECFASGDEHHNWLHDEDGYTIIQDHSNGYYVYAVQVKGELRASEYVAGRVDPTTLGIPQWLNISTDAMLAKRSESMSAGVSYQPQAPTLGALNNIVVFIRFSDETEWTDRQSKYETMFNGGTAGTSSLFNYYLENSYGGISVTSTMYPVSGDTTVMSYQDAYPRAYYQPYDSVTNPLGYTTANRTSREHTLLAAAFQSISSQIPPGLNLDSDGDGMIDNVCFVVKGSPTAWSTLLWPHAWALYTESVKVNGKRVYDYNLQLQSMMTVGVLVHEMGHTLGAPDLYRYTNKQIDPVNKWDIMATNVSTPMHMGAHLKWKYGKWIGSIPTIEAPGRYSLRPLATTATGSAYRIPSPFSTSEYFVIEYRKKTLQPSVFERSLPGEGLVVSRIYTSRTGNANGPPDEVYVYRPDGSLTVNGNPSTAALSRESGRAMLNDETNPWAFLSTGRAGGLSITDISPLGDSISFTLGVPLTAAVEGLSAMKRGDSVEVTWRTRMQYRCKRFEVQRAFADTGVFATISGSSIPGSGTTDSMLAYRWVDRGNGGEMFYRITRIDSTDAVGYSPSALVTVVSSVFAAALPAERELRQNYPNPFNPITRIHYMVEHTGPISLRVYDLLGREVATLVNGIAEAGHRYDVIFDGRECASGVYYYVLQAGGKSDVRKMLLLR